MTLEHFFHSSLSLPLRWPVKLAISAVAAVYPGSLPQLAKKMRELFSPRLNDLLYEYLFLYNTKLGNFAFPSNYVSLNTSLPIQTHFSGKDYVQAHFYFHGFPAFFPELLYFCDNKTAFFDLGANMGLVSVGLSKFLPQNHIFAFEALPSTYARLKDCFAENCPRANCYNIALSSQSGFLTFSIPSSDSGSASANASESTLIDTRSISVTLRKETVPCERFSIFYDRIQKTGALEGINRHAFKIDVEGHEIELLEGMKEYFYHFKGEIFIVVEVRGHTAKKVHEILSSSGFAPKSRITSAASLATDLHDCIYVRAARAD